MIVPFVQFAFPLKRWLDEERRTERQHIGRVNTRISTHSVGTVCGAQGRRGRWTAVGRFRVVFGRTRFRRQRKSLSLIQMGDSMSCRWPELIRYSSAETTFGRLHTIHSRNHIVSSLNSKTLHKHFLTLRHWVRWGADRCWLLSVWRRCPELTWSLGVSNWMLSRKLESNVEVSVGWNHHLLLPLCRRSVCSSVVNERERERWID